MGPSRFLFFDLQGTLVRRDHVRNRVVPIGRDGLLDSLRSMGYRIYVLTNANRSTESVLKDLRACNLDSIDGLITSTQVAGEYILHRYGPSRLYVIGTSDFKAELERYGHVVSDEADIVVVGFDPGLTYDKLNHAMRLLLNGARLITTARSRVIPEGPLLSIGPVAVALSYATGVRPIVTGKPSRIMYIHALVKANALPEESAIISDDIEDLVYARKFDMRTVLVLTGATKLEDLGSFKPDLVLNNVDELLNYLKRT
jgi:HAD superfamily hydrolase (TIGR01450 family)